MAEFFDSVEGRPVEGFQLLNQVFHLEDQLATYAPRPGASEG